MPLTIGLRSPENISISRNVIKAGINGLTTDSIVKCEQIGAIAKLRLQSKKETIAEEDMKAIDKALKITLDIY